jgi:hypothetical protein
MYMTVDEYYAAKAEIEDETTYSVTPHIWSTG